MKKLIPSVVATATLALSLTACGSYGEAHDHNATAPANSTDLRPDWHRIDTPYHYSTIIASCVGTDGVYDTLANDSSVDVVPNDPACAK